MKNKAKLKKMPSTAASIILLVLAIASLIVVYALSFTSSPTITPTEGNAYTDDDLICSWEASGDTTETNVSWYLDGALFSNETTAENSSTLSNLNTTKNQEWTCNVTISNATASTYSFVKRNISNSPPAEPSIYNESGQDLGTSEILTEDIVYTFDINSTDPDNDTLSYRLSPTDEFCTVTDEDAGTVTCSPTTNDLGANETEGKVNITFWADDTDSQNNPRSTGHTVQFNITPVNDEPYFDPAITDQTATEDTPYTYDIIGFDEENNTFNITMTQNLGPRLIMNITSNTTAQITFDTPTGAPDWQDRGNYTVNLTIWEINDSTKNTSVVFSLEVNSVNQAPVITNYSSLNGTQGQNFTFWINATDENVNDVLNFTLTAPLCTSNPWSITTENSSANATGLINLTLNNSHVVCMNVTITVSDGVATGSIELTFNITNINDPPVIHNISNYDENSGANTNLNNLLGATGLTFSYRVNASDIDILTPDGDNLTFATNNSNFSIDSATGLISFVPDNSLIGNWTVQVNVTDLNGSTDTANMSIRIINNTAPNITEVTNISCVEDSLCSGYIDAVDPDPDDNLTFTSNNTDLFELTYHNTTAASYSFTPDNDDVGNHSIQVNATDLVGALDTMTFILQINNTNDAPIFDNDLDGTGDNISLGLMVENKTTATIINVTDDDIIFGDNLTYNITFILGDSTLFNITWYDNNSAIINCTPNSSQIGDYSVNFSVTDNTGAEDWQIVNFTVYNASEVPVISEITPYWNSTTSLTIFDNYADASLFSNNIVDINFSENKTVTFNAHFTDNDSVDANVTFYWYYDGEFNETITASDNTSLTIDFGFFTAGIHSISLQIQDNLLSETWWTWTINISNVNRAPLLINKPDNRTGVRAIGSQITLLNYLSYYDTKQRFIDPDDDLNSNYKIAGNVTDPNEVNTLEYTFTDCAVASISASSDDLTIAPNTIGTCNVTITASDGEYNATSTNFTIEVIAVPPTNTGTTTISHTRTVTQIVYIPIPQDVQKPVMLKIITPTKVITYKNKTIVMPIRLRNNWNSTLYGIFISASVNESNAKISLSKDAYSSLEIGQEEKINLSVTNYREDGPYEIQITANVTEPAYFDVATILVNAIESRDRGDEVDIKITFAKDLLTQNAECQELNELLDLAIEKADDEEYDAALEFVDMAINGCKYLMSKKEMESQKQTPKNFASMLGENLRIVKIIASVFGILVLIIIVLEVVEKMRTSSAKKRTEKKENEK